MDIVEVARNGPHSGHELVLTLGSFDGLHIGHQAILRRVVAAARERSTQAAVMTLRPHPQAFFRPENPPELLTSDATRESLFAQAGLDILFYLPFDAETAALEREAFLDRILLGACGARHLVIGYDLRFGNGAKGDYPYLEAIGPEKGFTTERVDPVTLDGTRVSSSAIRQALAAGELALAERMLGRPYGLTGTVTTGRGLGKGLGFPTANIAPAHTALPADGIYVAEAHVAGQCWKAAVNVGYAPTLRHETRTVEAFLLDFSGELLGVPIELIFRQRIRPEKKFDSLDDLKSAIAADVTAVRDYFA